MSSGTNVRSMGKNLPRFTILWPNNGPRNPTFLKWMSRWPFQTETESGSYSEKIPQFRFQLERGWRRFSFLWWFSFELLMFSMLLAAVTDVLGIVSTSTDEPSLPFLVSTIFRWFPLYLLFFVSFREVPISFWRKGFTPRVRPLALVFNLKDHYIPYKEIRSISFRPWKHLLADVEKLENSDPNEHYSLWAACFFTYQEAYISTRTLQEAAITTRNGKTVPLPFNLYEDIYPILEAFFGQFWKESWYLPNKEDKFHPPELRAPTGNEKHVKELIMEEGNKAPTLKMDVIFKKHVLALAGIIFACTLFVCLALWLFD